MTFDLLNDVNWGAVILAALAYFTLGAIWYAPPVLGNTWMAAAGTTMPEGQRPSPAIYVIPLGGSLLSAIVLGMLAIATDTDTVSEGLVLGLVVAIGFALPIAIVTATFESTKPKPYVWGLINAGYHVLGSLIAAVIIALMA